MEGKLAPSMACDKYGDLKIARMLLGTHFRDANELHDRMPLVTAVPTPGITLDKEGNKRYIRDMETRKPRTLFLKT